MRMVLPAYKSIWLIEILIFKIRRSWTNVKMTGGKSQKMKEKQWERFYPLCIWGSDMRMLPIGVCHEDKLAFLEKSRNSWNLHFELLVRKKTGRLTCINKTEWASRRFLWHYKNIRNKAHKKWLTQPQTVCVCVFVFVCDKLMHVWTCILSAEESGCEGRLWRKMTSQLCRNFNTSHTTCNRGKHCHC